MTLKKRKQKRSKRKKKSTPANRRTTGADRAGNGGTIPPKEHRFKKGESGNPSGRPKTKLLTQAYRELLEQISGPKKNRKTLAQVLAQNAVEQAKKGSLAALKEITDRTEGKAVQPLSHSGLGSEPITFIITRGRGK
ncbi:MAG: DUF5681 domain-containing protein [Nitrospiraceae bacterium]